VKSDVNLEQYTTTKADKKKKLTRMPKEGAIVSVSVDGFEN